MTRSGPEVDATLRPLDTSGIERLEPCPDRGGDVLWVDAENGVAGYGRQVLSLTRQEVAVLAALAEAGGRVVSRDQLARGAGLRHASPRRAESLLVTLRKALGCDAVRTVRGRGWALDADAIVVSD